MNDDLLSSIFAVVGIVVLIAGGIFVVNRLDNYLGTKFERECVELGEMIGLNTRLLGSTCYIEIEPNTWVAKYNAVYYLGCWEGGENDD